LGGGLWGGGGWRSWGRGRGKSGGVGGGGGVGVGGGGGGGGGQGRGGGGGGSRCESLPGAWLRRVRPGGEKYAHSQCRPAGDLDPLLQRLMPVHIWRCPEGDIDGGEEEGWRPPAGVGRRDQPHEDRDQGHVVVEPRKRIGEQ